MIQIDANCLTAISLGRQGENEARQIVFDLSGWMREYGDGSAELIHHLSGASAPYPVAAIRDGSRLVWTVSNSDTAEASSTDPIGHCELRWRVDSVLVKSRIWPTWVTPALPTPSGTAPPAPEQGWVEQVLEAAAAAVTSADLADNAQKAAEMAQTKAEDALSKAPRIGDNGNWYIWDTGMMAYVDTGNPSGGIAPYIGENGHWYIGTEDSGIAAAGPKGDQGASYTIGAGLKLDAATNTLMVDTTNEAEKDNTRPITSAGVYTLAGNIEVLLAAL